MIFCKRICPNDSFHHFRQTVMTGSGQAIYNKITVNAFPKSGGNSSALALAAANCDPDYGWIDGPEGTNKCYMYLKVDLYSYHISLDGC